MRLMHTHHLAGPGRVVIAAPDLPVWIIVDPDAEYRSVDILADKGQRAWAGPSGIGGIALGIEVGRPTLKSALLDNLGLRQGSSVSGGGSVISGGSRSVVSGGSVSIRATGRGSIAAGGNIENVVTGDNARIIGGKEQKLPGIGVHVTTPPLSIFEIKSAQTVTVLYDGAEMTVEHARNQGWIGVADR